MKKLLLVLALVAAMAGIAYQTTFATTDAYDTPTTNTNVAGIPLCITFSGTSDSPTTDLAVTVPDGFVPSYVIFWQDYDAAAGTFSMQWFKGMPLDSGFSISAAGDPTYVSSNGITYSTTANTITVAAEMQLVSGNYVARACR